ncbi:hypothetical protein U5N28_16250 [Lysinibacillus telephonicus]|uniref:hypothetical protein n=1 Tax=Lysinibacillus telephonicus TaxID=1714840 RepID=UPI00397C0357
MRITYTDVNRQKFVDELQGTGLNFSNVYVSALNEGDNRGAVIEILDDSNEVKVIIDGVYAIHDPLPSPQEPSVELKNRADIDYIAIMTGVEL